MNSFVVIVGSRSNSSLNAELQDSITAFLHGNCTAVFSRLDYVWVVSAETTADDIRDALLSAFNELPRLLVVRAGDDAAWAGFNELDSDWLRGAL